MTMFENGNPMCICGGEMVPSKSFFPHRKTNNCSYCGSWLDSNGIIHLSDSVTAEVDRDTPVTVVIPSIKNKVMTRESVPDFWDLIVEREGNISEARNRGSHKADEGYLVFTDDDVSFDYEEVGLIIENLGKMTIAGIRGHSLGMLKGRMMIMRKSSFDDVGGFDEDMSWSEDSDFCIRSEKKGYRLKQLPRNLVKHKPHEKREKMWGGKWHYYLLKKHGFNYAKRFIKAFFRKIWSLV